MTNKIARIPRDVEEPVPPQPWDICAAIQDENLLGAALGPSQSWATWLAVLAAAFGVPLSLPQRLLFANVSGGRPTPAKRVQELYAVVGRRSGKTRIAAAIAVYVAVIEQHRLAPGEVGHVLLLAASRQQAKTAFEYVKGFLASSPILKQQIQTITADEIRLKGNIIIGVHAGSYRNLRGRHLLAVVADESSFWRDEDSAHPDIEVYRACIPALTAAHGLWIGISSPYRKVGLLYQKWRDHFGQASPDVLVVQGASIDFDPTLDTAMVQRAQASDPEAAASEWLGAWRNDLAGFLDDATIGNAIDYSRPMELPPRNDKNYVCFADSSGGRHDAYAICIGHQEENRFVADVIRGQAAPFDPQKITEEFATLAKQYRIKQCAGDNYSADWVAGAWKECGIQYQRSGLTKSQLALEALPLFMRGVVSIPDSPRLIRELHLLERRTTPNGKDIVGRSRIGSDDHAHALLGMLQLLQLASKPSGYDPTFGCGDEPTYDTKHWQFVNWRLQNGLGW
jgi:hypothetical protein